MKYSGSFSLRRLSTTRAGSGQVFRDDHRVRLQRHQPLVVQRIRVADLRGSSLPPPAGRTPAPLPRCDRPHPRQTADPGGAGREADVLLRRRRGERQRGARIVDEGQAAWRGGARRLRLRLRLRLRRATAPSNASAPSNGSTTAVTPAPEHGHRVHGRRVRRTSGRGGGGGIRSAAPAAARGRGASQQGREHARTDQPRMPATARGRLALRERRIEPRQQREPGPGRRQRPGGVGRSGQHGEDDDGLLQHDDLSRRRKRAPGGR